MSRFLPTAVSMCREVWSLGAYVGARFWRDHGFTKSAALSYDLLFALIPVIALTLGILAAFPALDETRVGLQNYLVSSFLPEQRQEISALFDRLVGNTRALAAVSIVGLVVTALLLFDTVDSVFNEIWRQTAVRPFLARLSMFWAIMTLLPLLIGGSIALSTAVARRGVAWGLDLPWLTAALVWIAPITLLTVAFAVGFFGLPYRRVRFAHALAGGLVAAFLVQALRWVFIWFIDAFPNFWIIYGVLAWIPIALLWVFLFWCIILFGAEITAAIPEWRQRPGVGAPTAPLPVRRLVGALLMIEQLLAARRTGMAVNSERLTEAAVRGLSEVDLRAPQTIIDQLQAARIIAPVGKGWQLARDPSEVTLAKLIEVLDLGYDASANLDFLTTAWRLPLASALNEADVASRTALSASIETLLETAHGSVSKLSHRP